MIHNLIPDAITPKDIPKGLIFILIVCCLLIGLSGLRYGGLEGWLHVRRSWRRPSSGEIAALICAWRIIWGCLWHFYL